jgi:hypothetical protein
LMSKRNRNRRTDPEPQSLGKSKSQNPKVQINLKCLNGRVIRHLGFGRLFGLWALTLRQAQGRPFEYPYSPSALYF